MATNVKNPDNSALPTLALAPLDAQGHEGRCPHCGSVCIRFERQGRCAASGLGRFHESGPIHGLDRTLVNARKEPKESDARRRDYSFSRHAGSCSACGGSYYAIEALFIDAPKACKHLAPRCFEKYRNRHIQGGAQNFQASLPGRVNGDWIIGESLTELGVMHSHFFGPFPAHETGRHFDGGKLFEVWDILKKACKDANARRATGDMEAAPASGSASWRGPLSGPPPRGFGRWAGTRRRRSKSIADGPCSPT